MTTPQPHPDDMADLAEELEAAVDPDAPELDGQSTTVEEAMDAITDEEGFVHESSYTTPAGSTVVEPVTPDDEDPPAPPRGPRPAMLQ
jgi:hypothetical protein